MSHFKSFLLLTILTVLLVLIGQLVGGLHGMVIFFFISLLMNVGAYWFSDKIVLRLYHATPLPPGHEVESIVRRLTTRAGLPMPALYKIPSATPNAFATGRNPQNAAVAVTEGILRLLSQEELEGVLAHEISHIKNRDTLISCIAAVLAGAIMILADIVKWGAIFGFGRRDERGENPIVMIAIAIVAPLAALLIRLAISRSRELMADETGARIAGSAGGLASALRKLHSGVKEEPMTEASPATSHLFIVNPLSSETLLTLFSTHPSLAERIKRLTHLDRNHASAFFSR